MIIPGGNKANKDKKTAKAAAKSRLKNAEPIKKTPTAGAAAAAVETPAYARYAQVQQAMAAAGGKTTSADSVVQNKGMPKWRKQNKSRVALIVAGVLAVAAIIGGSFWAVNADRANTNLDRAEQAETNTVTLAEEYYNNSQQIVSSAEGEINKAQENYTTAKSYVDEVTKDSGASTFDIKTMSTNSVNDIITTMQSDLTSARISLSDAQTTYEAMTIYEGQDAIELLNKEYEAKNWEKVNEIGAAIAGNANTISSLTTDVNTKTNNIFVSYQTLRSEADKTAQDLANNYYNVTIPNLNTIVSSDMNSIEQALNGTADLLAKINETNADQSIKEEIGVAHALIVGYQNLADSEFETYMAYYDQLQQNYNAGNYEAVSQNGEDMIDSATKINEYSNSVHENYTGAMETYAEYQETANEEYTQATFNIEFTENDLSNPEIMRYLINSDKVGKVISVEQCVYNSKNGEVSMLLDCIDGFGRPYTSVLSTTIASGLNREQLTVSELINRIKTSEVVTNQAFDTTMENVAGAGATGIMNAGQENEVSGNIEVRYSINASYDKKTDKTTITAQAIAIITDADGNITYKVYSIDPVGRLGDIEVTSELREEFSNKLAQKINADTSLEIVEENTLEQE